MVAPRGGQPGALDGRPPRRALGRAPRSTPSATLHLALAIVAVPAAVIAFAAVLMRLNGLYVRVAASLARHRSGDEDRDDYMRGPLEWLIVASLVIALITLVVWMAFIAEDPLPLHDPDAWPIASRPSGLYVAT